MVPQATLYGCAEDGAASTTTANAGDWLRAAPRGALFIFVQHDFKFVKPVLR